MSEFDGANDRDTFRALRKRRQKCGVKPAPGGRPITCCRLHSIEREKARQEEGLQVIFFAGGRFAGEICD